MKMQRVSLACLFRASGKRYQNVPLGYPNVPLGYQNAPLGYQSVPLGYQNAPLGYQNVPLGNKNVPLGCWQTCLFRASFVPLCASGTPLKQIFSTVVRTSFQQDV